MCELSGGCATSQNLHSESQASVLTQCVCVMCLGLLCPAEEFEEAEEGESEEEDEELEEDEEAPQGVTTLVTLVTCHLRAVRWPL